MTVISVAQNFHEKRAIVNRPVFSPLEDLSHLEHIVALKSYSWNHVTSFIELCVHWWSWHWCAHSVLVVLADVKSRQTPQFCHVCSLIELTLISSPITKQNTGHILFVPVLEGEGQASSNGYLGSNDAIASVEVGGFLVVVHRTSLTLGCSITFAKHFGYYLPHRVSSLVSLAVNSVSTDQRIIKIKSSLHTFRDGFLS